MSTHELPHARVIAIESEREFGLSVMQTLGRRVKHAATLPRLGVQDSPAIAQPSPTSRCRAFC